MSHVLRLMSSILTFLTALLLLACDRTIEEEIISITPPELHVIVSNEKKEKLEGVSISIYRSREDYENRQNELSSKRTDEQGKSKFTKEELQQAGSFCVRAEKGQLTNEEGSVETPYLLLNDGHTCFFIEVKE